MNRKLRLALDWTPNINHIGFFVAKERGFYDQRGIEIEIIDPSSDHYRTTPAKKIELGMADLALCPTESLISYRTKEIPFDLMAIATVFQHDLSAIAVKAESDISRPKDLDGRSYASYQARYEDQIVRQMIRNDGGQGQIDVSYPPKLGIWNTLMDDSFDSTWIFLNWEGVEAEAKQVPLHYFKMQDYDVPYGYSPVVAGSASRMRENESLYADFLAASKQGHEYASANRAEAAVSLAKLIPDHDQGTDLMKALDMSAAAWGDFGAWGHMDQESVSSFLQWIYDHQLERVEISPDEISTNHYLE